MSHLAKNVRHWRIAAGLTQTAAAKRSGMNRSYLSRLESGRRNPRLSTLERLAKTLKVTPGAFFEDVSARLRRTKYKPFLIHIKKGSGEAALCFTPLSLAARSHRTRGNVLR